MEKLANLSGIRFIKDKPENAVSFIVKTTEYYIQLGDKMDVEQELKRLRSELEYANGFLTSVLKKLNNERFVKNAPESVVQKEMEKKADAEARIKALTERIEGLS